MSTTTNTWLTYAKIGGNDTFVLKGEQPQGIKDVYGATFIKSTSTWIFPAFRPVHRKAATDISVLVKREGRKFTLDAAARAHLARMDECEALPDDFTFVTKPFLHQLQGLLWLYNHPRAGLFFDPGLGKCKITIDLYRATLEPMLILCPAVVLRTWGREFVTHGNIADTLIVEGTSKQKKAIIEEARKRPPAALICTYESADPQVLVDVPYKAIVLDESHRVKDVTSRRTGNALILSERRPRRVLLSGTPTLGNPLNLYPQFRFLGHYFASETNQKFKDTFAVLAAQSEYQIVGYKEFAKLNERVNEVCMRRKQEECLDLPERQIIDVAFDLSVEQKIAYNEVVENFGDPVGCVEGFAAEHTLLTRADGALRPVPFVYAKETVSKLNKLEQIAGGFVNQTRANLGLCNGCPRLEDCIETGTHPYTPACPVAKVPPITARIFANNARTAACRDLLDTILANPENKVIIWTRYIEELTSVINLAKELGVGYVSVRGGMDINDFEAAMHTFNTEPSCKLYIGQVASGIGVTLNAANYMIYYSLPWSHEHYNQSRARNYRIGQKKRVTVYRLLANGSTDFFKAAALDQKIDIEDMLTNADYVPWCPRHGAGRPVEENAQLECRCDGSIDRIVASIQPIQ